MLLNKEESSRLEGFEIGQSVNLVPSFGGNHGN